MAPTDGRTTGPGAAPGGAGEWGRNAITAVTAVAATAAAIAFAAPPRVAALAGAVAAAAAVVLIVVTGHRPFWACLLALLAGYAFLGRRFAYLAVGRVYVGEIVLGLGVLTLVVLAARRRLPVTPRRLPPEVPLLAVFVVWQAIRTVPFLEQYGVAAMRDAALWGYAAFALLVLLLVPQPAVERFTHPYGRAITAFLLWAPIAWAVRISLRGNGAADGWDRLFGGLKSGDFGVHLGGVAAFLLLFPPRAGTGRRALRIWVLWSLWWAGWIAHGITNRGGMISALLALGVTILLRPRSRWGRPLLAGLALGLLLLVAGPNVKMGEKTLSAGQVVKNLASVVRTSDGRLEKNKRWRLEWWRDIARDLARERRLASGFGYGINLGKRYGKVGWDRLNRSPHNVTMTILARSGVPGLLLWFAFLAVLLVRLGRRAAARAAGDDPGATRAAWLLAYLVAILFNASFDVYLEGPMGGIWFWSLVGMALTLGPRPVTAVGEPPADDQPLPGTAGGPAR